MRRLVLVLAAAALLAAAPAPAGAAPTVVTIGFDDSVADQYGTLAIRAAHGMHATFFVNSGVVGDSEHLSWAQLGDIAAAGHEIAGHTLTHSNVKKLKTAAAREAICGDRVNLFDHFFQPVSFAYP